MKKVANIIITEKSELKIFKIKAKAIYERTIHIYIYIIKENGCPIGLLKINLNSQSFLMPHQDSNIISGIINNDI